MQTPQLEKGKALVLVGPQGCGKTLLARQIAAKHGSFAETQGDVLDRPGELIRLMRRVRPRTLIVEGFPSHDEAKVLLKQLITEASIPATADGHTEMLRTPNFIFCTHDHLPYAIENDNSRRFTVVKMGPGTWHARSTRT